MLIIDKLLFSPITATVWAARQVHHAIEQEREVEPERLTAQLSELYMMLETGRISEKEFEAKERELLDRLDQIEEQESSTAAHDTTDAETNEKEIPAARSSP